MKRGDLWIAIGGGSYMSKPRPVLILQSDDALPVVHTDGSWSVTVVPLTSHLEHGPTLRIRIDPNERNGLDAPSSIQVDKITTLKANNIRRMIGSLDGAEMQRVGNSVAKFLGLPTSTSGE